LNKENYPDDVKGLYYTELLGTTKEPKESKLFAARKSMYNFASFQFWSQRCVLDQDARGGESNRKTRGSSPLALVKIGTSKDVGSVQKRTSKISGGKGNPGQCRGRKQGELQPDSLPGGKKRQAMLLTSKKTEPERRKHSA